MREILFRGKQAYNDQWAYSEYPFGTIHGGIVVHDFIPETVGQYTGLTDKNGTKIFEGDIVEGAVYTIEDGGYGVVSFDDGAFEVNGNNITGTFHENYWGSEFEIIGNIHDNPDLLEGE